MRQSSGTRRAYNEYGYPPKTSSGGSASRSGGATANPEVVVNGHGNDSSGDSVSSASRQRGGVASDNARLGTAANPNRSDMPEMGRRKPHEQTSSLVRYILYWPGSYNC